MNKFQRTAWFSVAIICAVCITVYTLSYIITMPGHVLAGLGGDGAKNDFAFLYQVIYGNGFWFDGMNYPYGDNIVFADGQATLSVLLGYCKGVTAEQALAVLWSMVGLSYVLSIVFIYSILRHFRVIAPIAIIFACLVGIFSPQLFRISGHYGLSYLCVVPMLFYWTIQYHERPHWRFCLYVFLLGVFMAFLHPYFAALVLVWVLSYTIGCFVFLEGRINDKVKHVLPVLISVIGVFAVIAMIMKVTDPITDRPVTPYGILVYNTRYPDIFTSVYSPFWHYIRDHHRLMRVFPYISTTDGGEGYTYLGLTVIFFVLFSFGMNVIGKLRKKDGLLVIKKDVFPRIWLLMALLALLLSMGVPYVWHMQWLLNYMSFMRQFRSLGRFSWIFYYIIAIYGVVVINTYYSRLAAAGKRLVGIILLLLSFGLWAFEANGYVKAIRTIAGSAPYNYEMFFSKSEQNWESFLKEHHYDKNDFQAILMIEFFHVGSDKLWVGDAGWKLTLACKAGFQLHKPIVDQLMSRSSWSQTEKQVKIAAGPYVEKPMLNDIKSNKPFLLLKYENDSLDPDQKYLLEAADRIGHFSQCEVYAFYPDRQKANDKRNADSINKLLPFITSQDTCIANKGDWYVDHMDGGNAKDHLFGKGAVPAMPGNEGIISIIPVKPIRDSQEYEFSAWFLLSRKNYTSPVVFLESLDSSGNIIETAVMNTKCSVDNYGLWFRGSLFFRLRANCRSVRCRLLNDPNPSYEVMDELMLRPSDALIISRSADGSVMVNNHLFRNAAGGQTK